MPHDGYGIAWRKQPEFLIRLNYDTYSDPALKAADIEKFKELFLADPEALNLVGGDALRTDPANEIYWFYNYYLVDNNALQEEVLIGSNRIFDSQNGLNQFLQKSKVWIESGEQYKFELEITKELGTKGYITPLGGVQTLLVNKGVTYPNYVPVAGELIVTSNSNVNLLDAEKGNFGIGVSNTKGGEWVVKDLYVRSIVQTFPMHLFKFKIPTTWDSSAYDNFSVNYWGIGYDPNLVGGEDLYGKARAAI